MDYNKNTCRKIIVGKEKMDRNTIGNEIEAEINASYRYKNLRELIDILLSVIILKTGKRNW